MIGRKISDQAITCKVIKPFPTANQSSNHNSIYKSQPQKLATQTNCLTKKENNYIFQTDTKQGRYFGINSNEAQSSFKMNFDEQNQFNQMNSYPIKAQIQNTLYKNGNQVNSRNVTHFFINNKEKPINIEAKKTIPSSNSSKIKQQLSTPSNPSLSNISSVVQTKQPIQAKSKDQKIIKEVNNKYGKKAVSKQNPKTQQLNRNSSKNEVKNAQKDTNVPKTTFNSKQKRRQRSQSKRKEGSESITINKNVKSPMKAVKSPGKVCRQPPRPTKQPLKTQTQSIKDKPRIPISSSSKERTSLHAKSSNAIKKPEIIKQRIVQKDAQSPFKPWEQKQSDLSIQMQQELNRQELENAIKSTQNSTENITEKPSANASSINTITNSNICSVQSDVQMKKIRQQLVDQNDEKITRKISQVQVQKPKPKAQSTQKKYFTVKEQIQEKLKQKKIKQKIQIENKRRQQARRHEEQKQKQAYDVQQDYFSSNLDQQQDDDLEQLQERRSIPQPITLVQKVQPTLNQSQQKEIKLQGNSSEQNVQNHLEGQNEFLFSNEDNKQTVKQGEPFLPKKQITRYHYVQSSDQDQEKIVNGEQKQIDENTIAINQLDKRLYQHGQEYEDENVSEKGYHEQQNYEVRNCQNFANFPEDKEMTSIRKVQGDEAEKGKRFISEKNKNLDQSQEQSGSQEDDEEQNPKLQQYLRKRNLIAKPKVQSSQQHKNPQSKSNINQLINNYTQQSQVSSSIDRNPYQNNITNNMNEVIVQLDEEYLQSSIVVKEQSYIESQSINQEGQNLDQCEQLDNSQQYRYGGQQFLNYDPSKVHFNDSSDEDEQYEGKEETQQLNQCNGQNYPQNQESDDQKRLKNPLNNIHQNQLFELNLESLLNKQFIQLHQ